MRASFPFLRAFEHLCTNFQYVGYGIDCFKISHFGSMESTSHRRLSIITVFVPHSLRFVSLKYIFVLREREAEYEVYRSHRTRDAVHALLLNKIVGTKSNTLLLRDIKPEVIGTSFHLPLRARAGFVFTLFGTAIF